MSWYAIVGCPDCTGQKYWGCFDGGTKTYGPYGTEAEARAAGEDATKKSIYYFDVEERA